MSPSTPRTVAVVQYVLQPDRFVCRENVVGTQQLPVLWLIGWARLHPPVNVGTVYRAGRITQGETTTGSQGSRHVPMRK